MVIPDEHVITAFAGLVAAIGFALYRLFKVVLGAMHAQQKEFTTFLGNHMSDNTRAQRDTAVAMERVADRLEGIEDTLRRPRETARAEEALRPEGRPPRGDEGLSP